MLASPISPPDYAATAPPAADTDLRLWPCSLSLPGSIFVGGRVGYQMWFTGRVRNSLVESPKPGRIMNIADGGFQRTVLWEMSDKGADMRKTAIILVVGICSLILANGEPTSKPEDEIKKKLMDEYGDMLSVLTLSNDQKSRFHKTLDAVVPQMVTARASDDAQAKAMVEARQRGDRTAANNISKQRQIEREKHPDPEPKLYKDLMSILTYGQQLEWKDYCQKRRKGSSTTQSSSMPATSIPATQPVNGLLGLPREQISTRLHSKGLEILPPKQKPPKSGGREKKKPLQPMSPWLGPKLPAVELRQFPWKKVNTYAGPLVGSHDLQIDIRVGFDEHGRARYLCGFGRFTITSAQKFLNELAPGNPDQETGMIFPPLSVDYKWYADYEVWRNVVGGMYVHRSGDVMYREHKDNAQMAYMVSRGKGSYSVWVGQQDSERKRSGMPAKVTNVMAMDSETFWRWTLEELSKQVVEGMRSLDSGKSSDFEYIISTSSYEEVLGYLAKKGDQGKIALHRLGMAVTVALRNPEVPVELLQPAAAVLALKDGKNFLRQSMLALESGTANVRPRIARLFAYLRDPDAIESLTSALRRNPQLSEAVFALKGITGEDLGNDPAKWQQWRDDNKERIQDLKRQSKALLESTTQPVPQGE